MITLTVNKRLCPFLLDPFENCYCVRMDSQDIERAINLCSRNFELCEIYKENSGSNNGGNKKEKIIRGNGNNNSKQAAILNH